MATRRTAKIARAIRESVSSTILFELKDPRVQNVTVLDVEVSDDVRSAKVYVSVMGEEKVKALTMHGLDSSRGFLQKRVADRIQTRWTPILKFILDDGVQRSAETAKLLREMEEQYETHAEEVAKNEAADSDILEPEEESETEPEKEI